MIVRNGLAAARRTPLKSVLFFILIFALVTALILGQTLRSVCSSLLERCETTYQTTALLEYQGSQYPDRGAFDPDAAALREAIDFDALLGRDCVLACDRSEMAIVAVQGLESTRKMMPAPNVVIGRIAVYSVNRTAQLRETLYSPTLRDGSVFRLDAEAYGLEAGHQYLVCGITDGSVGGSVPVELGSVYNHAAERQGKTLACAWVDVTETGLDATDPAQAPFYEMAAAYETINRALYAQVSADLSLLDPFSQGEYTIRQGEIYTPEQAQTGAYCMLPENVANRLGLEPGDEISFSLMPTDDTPLHCWWPGGEPLKEKTYTVSGVISSTAESAPLIYLSETEGETGFCGYTLGTLLLKNGTPQAELDALEAMLPPGVVTTVYDQGYAATVEAITELNANANILTAVVAAAVLSVLVLFASLLIGRQEETLVTMYMLGTQRKKLRLYTAVNALAVLLPAVAAAMIAARSLYGRLAELVFRSIPTPGTGPLRFSNENLGVTRAVAEDVEIPWQPGAVCAAAVVAVSLLLCLFWLSRILRRMNAGKKVKRKKPGRIKETRAATCGRGAGKFLLLSVLRGGFRTLVPIALCLVMVLSMAVMDGVLRTFRERKQAIDENTVISGYFTDYSGKRQFDLLLTERSTEAMENSDLFTDFQFSSTDPYKVLRVVSRAEISADGTVTDREVDEEAFVEVPPYGSFAYENFIGNLMLGPRLVYTTDLRASAEFAGADLPEITWLPGWDENFFSMEWESFTDVVNPDANYGYTIFGEDHRLMDIVVPESFLKEYGVSLGDTVELMLTDEAYCETYRIIGSFHSAMSTMYLYTRMDNASKVILWQRENFPEPIEILAIRANRSCGIFALEDTTRLDEAKDFLENSGYCLVRTTGRYRIYPILRDAGYRAEAGKLERSIRYLQILLPILAGLLAIAGFAAAVLMLGKRKSEIGSLRAVGTYRRQVFGVYFTEQLLLCLLGVAVGLALIFAFDPAGIARLAAPLRALSALSFPLGYLLGSLLAAFRASRSNMMDLMKERE